MAPVIESDSHGGGD